MVDVDTGEVLGPNKPGELWLRGPQVMKGYLNKPEETRKAIDEQGWLHTGINNGELWTLIVLCILYNF